jgi:hypothetical protein
MKEGPVSSNCSLVMMSLQMRVQMVLGKMWPSHLCRVSMSTCSCSCHVSTFNLVQSIGTCGDVSNDIPALVLDLAKVSFESYSIAGISNTPNGYHHEPHIHSMECVPQDDLRGLLSIRYFDPNVTLANCVEDSLVHCHYWARIDLLISNKMLSVWHHMSGCAGVVQHGVNPLVRACSIHHHRRCCCSVVPRVDDFDRSPRLVFRFL